MHMKMMIPAVTAVALAVTACEGQGTKQTAGTLVGAAAGGLLGALGRQLSKFAPR